MLIGAVSIHSWSFGPALPGRRSLLRDQKIQNCNQICMEEQPEAGFSCRRAERISSLGRNEHFGTCHLFTGDDIPLVRCLCHRNKLKDMGMDGKDSGEM